MYYIRENELVREALFALQGLNGRIIYQKPDNGVFVIRPEHANRVDPTQKFLVEKLTILGWLVNKIKSYIKVNKDKPQGRVSQCLAFALDLELSDWNLRVTEIERQFKNKTNQECARTRASTPTSELYGCAEVRCPKSSATYESLHTALAVNCYNNGNNLQANSDDGFGSQMYSVPSSELVPISTTPVTLHQIHVLSIDYYFRLKTLAMLVECCKDEQGGRLASIVYRFMQQSDKQIRPIITRILGHVVSPIRQMLSQWIFHGEIQDPFNEFFICLDEHFPAGLPTATSMMYISSHTMNLKANNQSNTLKTRNLPTSATMNSLSSNTQILDEKQYIINDYMLPGFISRQQANKILATGKAIHLLRKVTSDPLASSVPGYDDLKKSFESTNIESLFSSRGLMSCGEENEFEHLLNTAYKEVSQKALELLFGNYKLRSHFRGLRQYMLLGQGDFIRHLMDLLKTELDKPTSECRFHNILSVLESAMRSTNAQFDEPDVTNRLDCRLLESSTPNATGWDIFTLVYKVDGPISSIFTEEKVRDYIEIFRQLWRTKRIEHVLTSLWSNQMHYSKHASRLPLLRPVFHRANTLLTHMIHSMQHIQNYIMFEVVECSWVELVAATDVARDVDDVIAAHDSYLKKIKTGTMCQKDTLFDCVLEFQQLMNALWKEVDSELMELPEMEARRALAAYQSRIQTLANKFQANRQLKLDMASPPAAATTTTTK